MVAPAAPSLAESEEERLGRCGSGRAGGSGDGNSAMLLAPAVDDGLIVIVGDVGVVEDDTSGDVSNGMPLGSQHLSGCGSQHLFAGAAGGTS